MIAEATADTEVSEFARAVRAALADLTPDEIDDLTDGLEFDLADQLADGASDLGDPVEYAAELRTAAGMPLRDSAKRANPWSVAPIIEWIREVRKLVVEVVHANPALAGALGMLNALRPVWWVMRGFLLSIPFVYSSVIWDRQMGGLLFVLAALLVSVQWGRGTWMPRRALPIVATIATLVALLVLPAFTKQTSSLLSNGRYGGGSAEEYTVPGLAVNGESVSNLFVYDADGNLLTDVQVFDQNGKPVSAGTEVGAQWRDWYDNVGGESYYLLPRDSAPAMTPWNVYPLRVAPYSAWDEETGSLRTGTVGDEPTPPFDRVQPLLSEKPTDEPSNSTPGPTDGSTPTPTPSGAGRSSND